ncbi:cache domain-containing sensor histidine kinase [Paenibacillus thalictri]|uniref:Sensor histidine kinase n=1 Tax=Paenibacillus thalictri TaxID=2527873 RepID=A0A4Q9DZ49_9BACL|nr:sensor histidine kinase [Paenibacillus thalictri]TBL81198.1 sensor histidine kinase [Paenibacillus thalictri]
MLRWFSRKLAGLRNFSLEWKVFLMTSIVILLAVPLTGMISFYQAAGKLQNYAYTSAESTAYQLSVYMNNELKNVSDKLYLINTSKDLQQTIDWSQNKYDASYSVVFNKVFSLFSNIRLTSGTIRSIYLYTPKGEFYAGLPMERLAAPFKQSVYYEAISDSPTNRWIYLQQDPLFAREGEIISLVTRPAVDTGALDLDSYIVITLAAEPFIKNLNNIQLVDGGFSAILDEQGNPIISSYAGPVLKGLHWREISPNAAASPGFFDMDLDGRTYLVNHQPISFAGWQAVIFQPKDKLMEPVSYFQYVTLAMTAILLVCSFLLNKYIARLVTNPVRRLQRLMSQAGQGNLQVRFASSSTDEIGELGSRFDELLGQIQKLLRQVVEESQGKRRAEMRALQAQINPHFLYNTLDEIYWKALEFQDPAAADIILSLSRFFRLSLNRGEEATTVAKEMEHVEQYLKLVNYQYKRQFSFDIAVGERTGQLVVPKIILQPLAENSVLHAFKANEYKNFFIKVSSRFEEPHVIVLQVEDNGSGIEPALVRKFNEPHHAEAMERQAETNGEGYAVANIKERLAYFYGEKASLHVESRLGEGTRIVIRIAAEAGEERLR